MGNTGRKNRKGGGRPSGATESTKKQIATIVLKEKLTLDNAAARFGVSRQTINRWVHQYYTDIEQTNVLDTMNEATVYPIELMKRTEQYESKLREAHLKITALETMIE